MKTIIYILIALILSSILISSLPMPNKKTGSLITLECTDQNLELSELNASAAIFENRLKTFSSEKFSLTVVLEKNQIQIMFSHKWDLNIAVYLLLQKGEIGFYETFDQEGLSALLNGDNHLFSLLNEIVQKKGVAEIGCTTDLEKIDNYIKSLGLNNKCKFVWSKTTRDEACLYALKLVGSQGSILNESDIESMNYFKNKNSDSFEIGITFNEKASDIWSDASKRNINNAIAIVIDNNVIYAPILKSVIENGKCSISGNFTQDETKYITALGKNGKLPVSFKLVK